MKGYFSNLETRVDKLFLKYYGLFIVFNLTITGLSFIYCVNNFPEPHPLGVFIIVFLAACILLSSHITLLLLMIVGDILKTIIKRVTNLNDKQRDTINNIKLQHRGNL